ncbi:MAG: hypothetical protein RL508_190 [Actinomycetota bacterium]|jgi:uncharacterized protein with FMN-binding domain
MFNSGRKSVRTAFAAASIAAAVALLGSNATAAMAATKTGTKVGASVPYQFGSIQLTVTEKAGKITKITYGNSSATNGRQAAFPYLVKYAIQSQGINFGNLSGATMTTDTFKQALTSALSKF